MYLIYNKLQYVYQYWFIFSVDNTSLVQIDQGTG